MGAILDQGDPGETDDAPPMGDVVAQAVMAGHDLSSISDHVNDNRPSLAELWAPGSLVGQEAPKAGDQDKVNEGAGPIGEAVLAAGAGVATGIVRGALASGVMSDIAGAQANPIRSLVTTTNEGSSAVPFMQRQISGDAAQSVQKWMKYAAAGVAGDLTWEGAIDAIPNIITGDVRGIGSGKHKDNVGALPPQWVRDWKPGDPVPR